jgi:hypothetical protein
MPFWPQYSAKTPFAKFVPLSVMMLCGTPYLVMISLKNLMVDEPSHFLIGLASIYLVNTATSRCVKPLGAVLNGPTMSRPQIANG